MCVCINRQQATKTDCLKLSTAKAKSCPRMAAQMWVRVNSVVGRQEVKGDSELSLSPDVINDHFQTCYY